MYSGAMVGRTILSPFPPKVASLQECTTQMDIVDIGRNFVDLVMSSRLSKKINRLPLIFLLCSYKL